MKNVTSILAVLILLTMVIAALGVPEFALVSIGIVVLLLMFVAYTWISPVYRSKYCAARYTHYTWSHYAFESMFTWLVPFCRSFKRNTVRMNGWITPKTIIAMKDTDCIHKLMGVSYGRIHKNSIRLGYSYIDDNKFALHLYSYNNGKRKSTFVGYAQPNHTLYLHIANKQTIEVGIETSTGTIVKAYPLCDYTTPRDRVFLLLPYFGGKEKPSIKCYSYVQFYL